MPDYQEGKIYKIVNDVDDEIYMGSTCNTLAKRWGEHKSHMNQKPDRKIYQKMVELGSEHFRIILVENYACNSKIELIAREEYWRKELNATLNMICCGTGLTRKEYTKQRSKQYPHIAKKRIYERKYKKQYLKKKIMCDFCKCTFSRGEKYRHRKTAKHSKALHTQIKQFVKTANQHNESYQQKHLEDVERFTRLSEQLEKALRENSS